MTAKIKAYSAKALNVVTTADLVDVEASLGSVIVKIIKQVVKAVILAGSKLVAGARVRKRRQRIAGHIGIAV